MIIIAMVLGREWIHRLLCSRQNDARAQHGGRADIALSASCAVFAIKARLVQPSQSQESGDPTSLYMNLRQQGDGQQISSMENSYATD